MGAHPSIVNSGWKSAWLSELPVDAVDLESKVKCDTSYTWTGAPGANENLPMNCIVRAMQCTTVWEEVSRRVIF